MILSIDDVDRAVRSNLDPGRVAELAVERLGHRKPELQPRPVLGLTRAAEAAVEPRRYGLGPVGDPQPRRSSAPVRPVQHERHDVRGRSVAAHDLLGDGGAVLGDRAVDRSPVAAVDLHQEVAKAGRVRAQRQPQLADALAGHRVDLDLVERRVEVGRIARVDVVRQRLGLRVDPLQLVDVLGVAGRAGEGRVAHDYVEVVVELEQVIRTVVGHVVPKRQRRSFDRQDLGRGAGDPGAVQVERREELTPPRVVQVEVRVHQRPAPVLGRPDLGDGVAAAPGAVRRALLVDADRTDVEAECGAALHEDRVEVAAESTGLALADPVEVCERVVRRRRVRYRVLHCERTQPLSRASRSTSPP